MHASIPLDANQHTVYIHSSRTPGEHGLDVLMLSLVRREGFQHLCELLVSAEYLAISFAQLRVPGLLNRLVPRLAFLLRPKYS